LKAQAAPADLKRAFTLLSPFVGDTTLLVLAYIHVQTDGQALRLYANNMEAGLAVWIPATIECAGSTLLPLAAAFDLLKVNSSGSVVITTTEKKVELRIGSSKTGLKVPGSEEFPPLPVVPDQEIAAFATNALCSAVRSVSFSASRDKGQPALQNICLSAEGGQLHMVATDGFRLALADLDAPLEAKLGKLLVSAVVLERFVKGFDEKDEDPLALLVPEDGRRLFVRRTGLLFFAQTAQAEYPAWQSVLPPSFRHILVLQPRELGLAVRRADIFARDDNHTVSFAPDPGSQSLIVEGFSAYAGNVTSAVPLGGAIDPQCPPIALNARFVLDVLGAFLGETLVVELNAPNAPALFLPDGEKGRKVLIMPIALEKVRSALPKRQPQPQPVAEAVPA
jgi:DNA polymerase-3 subunit beta